MTGKAYHIPPRLTSRRYAEYHVARRYGRSLSPKTAALPAIFPPASAYSCSVDYLFGVGVCETGYGSAGKSACGVRPGDRRQRACRSAALRHQQIHGTQGLDGTARAVGQGAVFTGKDRAGEKQGGTPPAQPPKSSAHSSTMVSVQVRFTSLYRKVWSVVSLDPSSLTRMSVWFTTLPRLSYE